MTDHRGQWVGHVDESPVITWKFEEPPPARLRVVDFNGRDLVVIDADDRASVERFRDMYDAAYVEQTGIKLEARQRGERGNALQAALREYANPTPADPPIYREDNTGNRPWPAVDECHSSNIPDHECPQCAWTHIHTWVAWTYPGPGLEPGVPIRCTKCGGRKCDQETCALQRHHDGDHEPVQ